MINSETFFLGVHAVIKLLIVDDEKTTRDGLVECIPWKELGVDIVKSAAGGIEALEIAKGFNPNIVLTDVRMPKMDGIELAKRLKLKFPECKVIFLSGYTDKEYLKSAIQLQAINYIEKPVNLEEVKEIIRKTVSLCKREEEKKRTEIGLVNKINESLPLLKEKLCLELTMPILNINTIKTKFDFLNIPFKEQCFCVTVLIKTDDGSENTFAYRNSGTDLIKTVSRLIEKEKEYFLCALKEPTLMVIHIFSDNVKDKPYLKKLLSTIKLNIENNSPAGRKLFIAAGSVVSNIKSLNTSYQKAVITLQKQFFLGFGNIVFFTEDTSPIFNFNKHSINHFLELLKAEKKNESELFVKKIVNEIKLCTNTLVDNIKNYFFNMLMGLSKIADEKNIVIAESEHRQEYFWDVISRAKTLHDIENYLLEKINLFFSAIEEKERSTPIVYSAIRYILNNYSNKNLSIKLIANSVFVTPNYLSLVFKKSTGKTINQFITETRMEKAKELLKDRSIKLYEIASMVGFRDANYFAKIFKKMEGMNPSEYREKCLL